MTWGNDKRHRKKKQPTKGALFCKDIHIHITNRELLLGDIYNFIRQLICVQVRISSFWSLKHTNDQYGQNLECWQKDKGIPEFRSITLSIQDLKIIVALQLIQLVTDSPFLGVHLNKNTANRKSETLTFCGFRNSYLSEA